MRVNLILFLSFWVTQNILAAEAIFLEIPASADSFTGTPFGVKVRATGVNSTDTSLKFCVWVYDQGTRRYISKIWTKDGWKAGWTSYQYFCPNSGVERTNWVYLKIYKLHTPDSFYISLKFKNSDTAQTKSYQLKILNMTSEGGWLAGTVYNDPSFTAPYQNVNVIAKSSGTTVGAHVTEDNGIDEGNPSIPGRFYIAVPTGNISSISFEDSVGTPLNAYFGTSPPWEIKQGETTWVDPVYIENVEFMPEYPDPGDSVIIRVVICNPGGELHNVSVKVIYKKGEETKEIGTSILNIIPPSSCAIPEITWRNIERGKYEIIIQVIIMQMKITTSRYIQVGIGDVIINEIMYSPSNSGEWIEVLNCSSTSVNIKGWSINGNVITDEDKFLPPNGFAVIAESTSQVIKSIYGEFSAEVVSPGNKFPKLRDNVDTLILKDNNRIVHDVLKYSSSWSTTKSKGVSLERISPSSHTNDLKNWGSCVIAQGGTPGKVNSIYAESIPKRVMLSVEPKVFSPHKEVTFIAYTLPFIKAHVRLYLYDKCGRCVRKLIDGSPSGVQSRHLWEKGEATWSHIWDGQNDSGKILSTGIYVIYLEAKDQLSEAFVYEKTTVVIAK